MVVGLNRGLAGVQLQGTTFSDTSQVTHVLLWNDTEVYSDGEEAVVRLAGPGDVNVSGAEAPRLLSDAGNSTLQFLSKADNELRQLVWVRAS